MSLYFSLFRLSERARDYRNSNSTLKEQNKKLSIELEEMRNRSVIFRK